MGNKNLVLKKVLFQLFLICSPLKSLQEHTFIKKIAIFLRSSFNMNKEYKNIVHPQNNNIIILNRTLILMPKSSDENKKDLYKFLD